MFIKGDTRSLDYTTSGLNGRLRTLRMVPRSALTWQTKAPEPQRDGSGASGG